MDFPFATIQQPAGWLAEAIPLFALRPEYVRQADRYDRDDGAIDLYTGIAYGHRVFGEGAGEGLYRTMSALVLASGGGDVLDAGCGVGRLLYDCAPAMPESRFCGVDLAYRNCRRAHQILRGGAAIPLDAWEHRGRPGAMLAATPPIPNVWIAQADAQALPFAPATFDAVCATLLLCQLPDPAAALAGFTRVLRPGGRLLLATPFGFRLAGQWQQPLELRQTLAALGYRVEDWFDGLLYREVLDARGNAHEWRVTVVAARAMA